MSHLVTILLVSSALEWYAVLEAKGVGLTFVSGQKFPTLPLVVQGLLGEEKRSGRTEASLASMETRLETEKERLMSSVLRLNVRHQ